MGKLRLLLPVIPMLTVLACAQEPKTPVQEPKALTLEQERALRVRYPHQWEVKIPEGSRLDSLRKAYDKRLHWIPQNDVADQSPYPLWFRAFLREKLPGLPDKGVYQYPRVAQQILDWMVAHPDLQVPPASEARTASRAMEAERIAIPGTNINLTNFAERNSESFIAVDYVTPNFLIGASNNITGSGRQKQFASSDTGLTWTKTELPLASGSAFHSDPAVAWTSDGTGWAGTLGINAATTSIHVQVYKSTNRGASWTLNATVSTGDNNDKELMCVDSHPTSPFKDNIYVVWDVPGGGMRFARSTNKGVSWSSVMSLSTDQAIGSHVATGPAGEVYVGWPDVNSQELRIRRSTDGGATFGPVAKIATTNDAFEISIPAMCERKALIYLSLGVDRSGGPRNGWVYAVWTDRDGGTSDPGCNGITSTANANIHFSRSTDGGTTWSASQIINTTAPTVDQFNPWMDVDPLDGTIHVMFYDTRDDPGRIKTNVYYIASSDGGSSWVDEAKVTTAQTDETESSADLGNQYGDYNGLVAYRGMAHPIWTDRRAGVPGSNEQIFTARVTRTADSARTTISVALNPNKKLSNGETTQVNATVLVGGQPASGRTVMFTTGDGTIASVSQPTAVTNANGVASTTVRGETSSSKSTSVTASCDGATASTPVQVPDMSVLAAIIVLLLAGILLSLGAMRRRAD
jgi:hypothetical protein